MNIVLVKSQSANTEPVDGEASWPFKIFRDDVAIVADSSSTDARTRRYRNTVVVVSSFRRIKARVD